MSRSEGEGVQDGPAGPEAVESRPPVSPSLVVAAVISAAAVLVHVAAVGVSGRESEVLEAVARAAAVEARIDDHRSAVAMLPSESSGSSAFLVKLNSMASSSGASVVSVEFAGVTEVAPGVRRTDVLLEAVGADQSLSRFLESIVGSGPGLEVISVDLSPSESQRSMPSLNAALVLTTVGGDAKQR